MAGPGDTRLLGMHIAYARGLEFHERVRLLRAAGFEATTLWWDTQDTRRKELRELAPGIIRAAGLEIDHFHVPYRACNALWSADAAPRVAALDQHRAWIEDCARHQVRVMVMHAVQGNAPDAVAEQGIESFGRLAAVAESLGITIALENTRRPELIDLLLEALPGPGLGLCYDCSHDALHSAEPLTLPRRWGTRLAALHLSDTDGRRDHHWLPGEGTLDFAAIGAACPASFQGALMLEAVPRDRAQAPAAFLADAHARIAAYRRHFVPSPPAAPGPEAAPRSP